MARPKQAPQRSMSLLATRTDRVTELRYNETKKIRKKEAHGGMIPNGAPFRIQMLGRLEHRDIILRSVSAACKLVAARADQPAWAEFRMQVVTAVGEAFNNIVLHSYAGRDDGVVEMDITTFPDRICVEFRDWGESFDPESVPLPDLDGLPESGLGIFIIKTLMEFSYAPGRPNVLTLWKRVAGQPRTAAAEVGQ